MKQLLKISLLTCIAFFAVQTFAEEQFNISNDGTVSVEQPKTAQTSHNTVKNPIQTDDTTNQTDKKKSS